MSSFFSELRRRNVIRVAIAYGIVGWVLTEVASVVFDAFNFPEWAIQLFITFVILGFPLVLIFAWAYELTPEGLKREHEVEREKSITAQTGRKLDFAIIGLLAIALAVSVSLHFRDEASSDEASTNGRLSIAVLPFTSRSVDPENVLFADGIHDDLLTTLAKISALKVISRTSVMEYRDTTKNLREIGDELGVENVMEGAVQKFGNNVRINVQLIDADTDEHLWAESYDRELTTQNLFAIQSEISNEIASALKTTLTPEEQSRIATVPTDNLDAYNYYLAGRQHMAQRSLEDLRLARQQFEKAIDEDPSFADAYSGLADSIMLLEYNHRAVSWDETRDLVSKYLKAAAALDKENANVYASTGLYKTTLWEREKVESALPEATADLERAIELNPNYAQAYFWLAVTKGQLELNDEAIVLYEKALELDPLARIPMANLGVQYTILGRHQDAIDQWLRAAELHGDYATPRANLGIHLNGLGRFDEGLAWMLEAIKLNPVSYAFALAGIYRNLGDLENAKAALADFPVDHPRYLNTQVAIAWLDGDYETAYHTMRQRVEAEEVSRVFTLNGAAWFAIKVGDYEAARDYLLEASPALADRTDPNVTWRDFTDKAALAYVAQRTGEDDYADIVLSRSLAVLEGRARLGLAGYAIWDVELYTIMGDKDTALAKLREAVDAGWRGPRFFWGTPLAENLFFDALRDEPEFQAIVAEIEADLARQRKNVEEAEATGNWQPLLDRAREVSVATAAK